MRADRKPALGRMMTCTLALVCAGTLCAAPRQNPFPPQSRGIEIEVTGAAKNSPGANGQAGFINGWAESLDGQTIHYHSAHPDAQDALIVRAQSIAHSITWKTDALPAAASGDAYHLLWLAGLEFSGWAEDKAEHTFEFFINGKHWFTFKNAKDATARHWSVSGEDGAKLSFDATTADKFGDLFGYMQLDLPKKDFPEKTPLTLSVVGQNADSADWYMTFEYGFHFTPAVREEPAEMRDAGAAAQVLRLSLDNLTAGRSIAIRLGGRELVRGPLNIGGNLYRVPIPAVKAPEKIEMRFSVNDAQPQILFADVAPVTPRAIYLVPYSHNDIGYTDYQPNIEKRQWSNLEEGLRLANESRSFPSEDSFKWNFETVWALDSYLRQATPEQKKTVLDAIRNGEVGVSALYANMLTGLANADEMSHFLDFARQLRAEYGIRATTAVTSDVPGYTWGIVPTLAHSGVKYFAVGPNTGDRIGYTLEAWGDKPFYWVSPSGREKILTWVAGAGYSMFHQGSLAQLGDDKIMDLVRSLDAKKYPYEMVYLPYTTGDNGAPDPTLAATVKAWNERYVTPRLVISTHEQMFTEFEKRYGASLPVARGDFTPYWEDGAASTARELALARRAVDQLIQGEALWATIAPDKFPAAEYDAAWRDVNFWDEHTWGADKSVSDPDLPLVKQEWDFKQKFALDASSAAENLLQRAIAAAPQPATTSAAFDVYNTSSWPRTDLVILPAAQSAPGDRVEDAKGQPVPSQRLTSGELAVLAENVPALGAKRLFVREGAAFARGSAVARPDSLETSDIALHVNGEAGAIDSLRWKGKNISLVDTQEGVGLGEYIYVPGTDATKAQRLTNVRVHEKEKGPLVVSLIIEGDAAGASAYSSEVRLVEGLARVDITTRFDKSEVREKEAVHIAFPFRVPGAQVRYDVADAIVRPEADQLPGACKNFFSVVSWSDASNADYGVTLAVPDAPLIEIGAITAEQPWMRTIQSSPLLFSYVMNNYWHTNYKADQEGPAIFSYSIEPHGAFSAVEAARFGRERREPLIVASADASRPTAQSQFALSLGSAMVQSIRPIAGANAWLAYLYNPAATAERVEVIAERSMAISLWRSTAFGNRGKPIIGGIAVPAHGSLYVRVERAKYIASLGDAR